MQKLRLVEKKFLAMYLYKMNGLSRTSSIANNINRNNLNSMLCNSQVYVKLTIKS